MSQPDTAQPATWYQEVTPEPESKLEQLAALHDDAKAAFDKAKERYDELKGAIKAELVNAAPGKTDIKLVSRYLDLPIRLTAKKGSVTVDGQRLRAEQPLIWEKYAKQGRPSWTLTVGK